MGPKSQNLQRGSRDLDHAPFKVNLSMTGYNQLRTYCI